MPTARFPASIDAGSPILRQDRQAKSAPLAVPLIVSAALLRLSGSITVSSEEAGGAERVGVGAGEDVGGGGALAAGDRAAAGVKDPEFFGGVARECVYDNLRSVVARREREQVVWNQRFLHLRGHYAFHSRTDGQTGSDLALRHRTGWTGWTGV